MITLFSHEKRYYLCIYSEDEIQNKMIYKAINIDPETMGGTPVFTGTRVPIQALFDYIETGETLEEFLVNFPTVTKSQTIEVLEMACTSISTEKILHENFALPSKH
jgi:uncharacterized protein (DUF433 family)